MRPAAWVTLALALSFEALAVSGQGPSSSVEPSRFPLEVAGVGEGLYAGLCEGMGSAPDLARSKEEMRALVREALQSSFGKQARAEAAVPLLVYTYRQIEADTALSASERETLRIQLRSRLITSGDRIVAELREQRAARERAESRAKRESYLAKLRAKKAAAETAVSGESEPIDAPRVPAADEASEGAYSNDFTRPPALDSPPEGSPGGGAEAEGEALVELIRRTIAPDTWDVNGGPGSISYYRPLKVLVVRQTAEIHWLLGGFRQALEK